MGAQSLLLSRPVNATHPDGANCFYQDIPPPSGKMHGPLPSGSSIGGRTFTMGAWFRHLEDPATMTSIPVGGTGVIGHGGTGAVDRYGMYLGYNDGEDHWDEPFTVDPGGWSWYKWTFLAGPRAESLRVMFYPRGDWIVDDVQLAIGRRLIAEQILKSESDREAWRNVNLVATCGVSGWSDYGEALRYQDGTSGVVIYPTEWGDSKVMGINCAHAASGYWMGLCSKGNTRVKVIYPVTAGDLLCAADHPEYPGYSISTEQVAAAAGRSVSNLNTYALAWESKTGTGPGVIEAYVDCNPAITATTTQYTIPIYGAPRYPNSVEGSLQAGTGTVPNYGTGNLPAAIPASYGITLDASGNIIGGYGTGIVGNYKPLADNTTDPILVGFDGFHNYYRWDRVDSRRAEREFTFDASGSAKIVGDLVSGIFQIGDMGEVGGTGNLPHHANIWIRSNEVYQEGLLIGTLGKEWGDHIERLKVKFTNRNQYTDNEVEAVALAYQDDGTPLNPSGGYGTFPAGWDWTASGAVYPSGWPEIGFDLRDGDLYIYGSGKIHDGITIANALPSGYIDERGDFLYWDPIPQEWVRNTYIEPNVWISPEGSRFHPSGIGLIEMSGVFRGDDSPFNSITSRLMVPHDFVEWASGSYLWNKVDLSPIYYDASGLLPSTWFSGGVMVSGYKDEDGNVAEGYTSGSVSYYIHDVYGRLVSSGVNLMNVSRNRDWTKTMIDLDTAGGEWNTSEWFTFKVILESEKDASAYAGEYALLYRNY